MTARSGGYKQYLRSLQKAVPRQTLYRWLHDHIIPEEQQIPHDDREQILAHDDRLLLLEPQDLFDDANPWNRENDFEERNRENEFIEWNREDERLNDPDNENANQPPVRSPIYEGSDVSHEEVVQVVMAYVLRHTSSGVGLQHLLDLINLIAPNAVEHSKYLFSKHFRLLDNVWQRHYYCKQCQCYIGELDDDMTFPCGHCNAQFNSKQARKDGNFFVYIPVTTVIKVLLEDHDVELIKRSERRRPHSTRSDIFDGDVFIEAMKTIPLNDDDITCTWNIDGVEVFETSESSMTPLQISVNELPFASRKHHVLMCGLWFGNDKTNIDTFLKPFIEEACSLHQNGFYWTDKTGSQRHSRVYFLTGCVDTKARAELNNLTQFNGEFGCNLCYHPGLVIPRGRGHSRIYQFFVPRPEDRTLELWKDDILEGDDNGRIEFGVKGPSCLLLLPNFDLVRGLPPDYMHCGALGVIKRMLGNFFDRSNHNRPYYIGDEIDDVDSRMMELHATHEITRNPLALSKRSFWKAAEYKNFLLYYSPFVLRSILPDRYFRHWLLLVFAFHVLLSASITEADLIDAEYALMKYVSQVEKLFGIEEMTMNMHLLTHLPNAVRWWGPLWAFSAFSFESNNHFLGQLVEGTRYVPDQIARKFLLWRELPKRLKGIHLSDVTASFLQNLLGYKLLKKARRIGAAVVLGANRVEMLSEGEKDAILDLLQITVDQDTVDTFQRVYSNGCIYTTNSYRQNSQLRRHDFCGSIDSKTFLVIEKIFTLDDDNHVIVLGKKFGLKNRSYFRDRELGRQSGKFIHEVSSHDVGTIICEASALQGKCMMVEIEGKTFLVEISSVHESD